jgi:hypothetical protein
MTVEEQARAVAERVDSDDAFADRLEDDPVGTLRDEGYATFADEVERAREQIAMLAERIYSDDEFRGSIEQNPYTLTDEGIPAEALQPVLAAVGAPDELIDAASSEVEAHLAGRTTAAAATAAVIGAFAFAGQAAAAEQPDVIRYKGEPAGFKMGSVEPNPLKRVAPEGWRYGSVQPNPMGSGSVEPNPFRSVEPNPLKRGSVEPNPLRWGSVEPNPRSYKKGGLRATLKAKYNF